MKLSGEDFKSFINTERSPENMYNLGIANKHSGHLDEAIKYFDEAILLQKDFLEAYNKRADCYKLLKKFREAFDDYALLFYHNKNIIYAIACAQVLLYNLNYDEAITWTNKAQELDRNNHEVYLIRGLLYFNKGNFEIAFKNFSLSLLLYPNDVQIYIQAGNTLGQMEMHSEAIVLFTKGLENAKNYNEKGMLLYNRAVSKSQIKGENYIIDFELAAEVNFEPAKNILSQINKNYLTRT